MYIGITVINSIKKIYQNDIILNIIDRFILITKISNTIACSRIFQTHIIIMYLYSIYSWYTELNYSKITRSNFDLDTSKCSEKLSANNIQ